MEALYCKLGCRNLATVHLYWQSSSSQSPVYADDSLDDCANGAAHHRFGRVIRGQAHMSRTGAVSHVCTLHVSCCLRVGSPGSWPVLLYLIQIGIV